MLSILSYILSYSLIVNGQNIGGASLRTIPDYKTCMEMGNMLKRNMAGSAKVVFTCRSN